MEQFTKYYSDRPIYFNIPSEGGIKLSFNIIEVGNFNGDIKEITLSLTNPEEYKMFTENIIRHYINKEIKNIMKLFSIYDDFIINFS
jgi:hypothetical protein